MGDMQVSGIAPGASAGVVGAAPDGAATAPATVGTPAVKGATVDAGKTETAAGSAAAAAEIRSSGPGDPNAAPFTNGQVKAAVKGANAAMSTIGTQLVFVFDDHDHQMTVKLLDVQTQKVVQQIAPQAMPATATALSNASTLASAGTRKGTAASGVLVDTKA